MENMQRKPKTALIAFIVLLLVLCGSFVFAYLNVRQNSEIARFFTDEIPTGELQVHIIDVGQGSSVLLRCSEGDILIDAGCELSEAALETYLDACKVDHLEYLILTHPHEDHIGGADMVVERFSPKHVITAGLEATDAYRERLVSALSSNAIITNELKLGDSFSLGKLECRVLAPTSGYQDENDMSYVLSIKFGERSFLFTGDAAEASEMGMLEYWGADELRHDVLMLGHHGSRTSSVSGFLEAVSPSAVVISCGSDNEYSHPSAEVLERLDKQNIDKIYRTDKDGSVVFVTDGSQMSVYSKRP